MTPHFDIGVAISDSFKLIRSKPLWITVWGGLLIILPLLPLLPLTGWFMANYQQLSANPESIEDSLMANMMINLTSLVQYAVMIFVVAAIVRWVLGLHRPKQFFGLRAGMDELWVLVSYIAYFVGFIIVFMLIVAVAALIGLVIGLALQAPELGVFIGILVALIAMLPLIWVLVRLSLLIPASIDHNTIALPQAWNATKGKFWPLFGTAVLTVLINIALMIAFIIVVGVVSMGAIAVGMMMGLTVEGSDISPWLPIIGLTSLILLLPTAFYAGAYTVISIAPFASAWRQMKQPVVADYFGSEELHQTEL